ADAGAGALKHAGGRSAMLGAARLSSSTHITFLHSIKDASMRTLLVSTVAFAVFAAGQPLAFAAEPKTDDEKALYALGVAASQSVASFDLTPAELELVKAGFSDGVQRKAKLEPSEYFAKLREM